MEAHGSCSPDRPPGEDAAAFEQTRNFQFHDSCNVLSKGLLFFEF
jgi:hypothetical protein